MQHPITVALRHVYGEVWRPVLMGQWLKFGRLIDLRRKGDTLGHTWPVARGATSTHDTLLDVFGSILLLLSVRSATADPSASAVQSVPVTKLQWRGTSGREMPVDNRGNLVIKVTIKSPPIP